MSIDCLYGLFICLENIVNKLIVNNVANFKMPLIDGAETVSTIQNNSKILFRKLLVLLIRSGRKKYMLLRIYIGLSMRVTFDISIQKYS
jgi:hypothetical protein